MKPLRLLCFISLLLAACAAPAQTIIDLNGGGVRGKDIDDLREEAGMKQRTEKDSLLYVDHLTRAFNALHDDSLEQAGRLFEQALKLRPDAPGNYVVRYNLGRIDMARGRYPKAAERFSAILRDHPATRAALYSRAVCFYEMNSLKAAADDCDALLRDERAGAEERRKVLFLQAAVHTRSRRYDLARQSLEEVLRHDPDNAAAALLLAGNLEETGQKQAALERLDAYVAARPDDADGRVARAQLHVRLGHDMLARADYDEAVRLRPEAADLLLERAKVLRRLGENGRARRDAERAIGLGLPRSAVPVELLKK